MTDLQHDLLSKLAPHSLADILEVELTIKAADERRERDEQLCKRWVHIHEEPSPDVL